MNSWIDAWASARPSGAKAHADSANVMRGLKPPPPSICLVIALLAMMDLGLMAQNTTPARPRVAHPAAPATASGYRIAGTVVNASTGEPVRRAEVAALAEADSHTVEAVESDGDGHFALDALAAGKYQLTASKRGFRTAFYDEHEEYSTAIVTGEGQDTSGLLFRLTPGATVRGVVTGDGGDPVEAAKVMLFARPRTHGRAPGPGERIIQTNTATTDDTGAYDFDNLPAGEYTVAVTAEPWYALNSSKGGSGAAPRPGTETGAASLDVAYPVTFFDSTTDEGSAAHIVLAAGAREEADINLHAVPALHLVVETPRSQDGSIARAELRQTIFGIEVSAQSAGFLDAMRTGTVEFAGVAPGHYELAQGDPPRITDLDASVSQQVDPSLGSPTVAVSGTLRVAPGLVLPESMSVSLNSLDAAHGQSLLQTNCIRGAFRFPAVPPGTWELEADAPGRTLPISSLAVGNRVYAGNQVTIKDRPIQLVASVSPGETRVEGFAHKNGRGKSGAMVVLVPREPEAFRALVRRDQSDSDGSFALRDVAPGHYTVVAIEDGWDLDWTRPEIIGRYLPQGIAVTVTEQQGKLVRLSEPVPVENP